MYAEQLKQIDSNFDEFKLNQIYKVANITQQVHMRDQDLKELVNYMVEVYPGMQSQFKNLSMAKTRQVVQNINFEVYEKGQQIFVKDDEADYAYLLLFGEFGIYNDIVTEKGKKDAEAPNSSTPLNASRNLGAKSTPADEKGHRSSRSEQDHKQSQNADAGLSCGDSAESKSQESSNKDHLKPSA